MGVINKVSGITKDDTDKIGGINEYEVFKVSGVQFAAAEQWIIGGQYRLFTPETPSDPTSTWSQLVQLFSMSGGLVKIFDIAYGKDGSGNKLWVIGTGADTSELAYCEDNAVALSRPFTSASNCWSNVGDIATDLYAVNGGPAISWGNDAWVAGGNDNNTVSPNRRTLKRSTTGTSSWAELSSVPQHRSHPTRGVCYHEGNNWFAVHDSDVWKSTDNGATWTRALQDAGGVLGWFNCLAYDGDGMWVAAGNAGRMAYSADNWATATEVDESDRPFNNAVYGIAYCYGIGKWVTCASGGKIGYTGDPTGEWTSATTPTGVSLNGIATDGTTIVAVGDGGTIITSTDGSSWTDQGSAGLGDLYSVACDIIGAGMR